MPKATHEQLQELYRLLVSDLLHRVSPADRKKVPSAELLAVARKVLRDARQGPPDEATHKALRALYRTYLSRLSEALLHPQEGRPSAALLAEARSFLAWHGVGDIPGTAAGKVAEQLQAADVPFRLH